MIRCPQIPRATLNSLTKVTIMNQPIAIFITICKFMLYEVQTVGEEEGEGCNDRSTSLIEAAGGETGYVDNGL
jgi:hypothetical protein